jgi:hypothetical protein
MGSPPAQLSLNSPVERTPLLGHKRAADSGCCGLSANALCVLACASLSCFAGGTMYVFGVWGLQLKADAGLSQLQTNVLGGVIFSGGSFLTNAILSHAAWSLRGAALLPACVGCVCYLLLARLPITSLSFGVLVALIAGVGYSVMGLFIAAVQAISFIAVRDHFNVNVGTAIAQSSYGVGCVAWVLVFSEASGSDWRTFCWNVSFPTLAVGLVCAVMYPSGAELAKRREEAHKTQQEQLGGAASAGPQAEKGRAIAVLVLMLLLYMLWYGSAIVLLTNSGSLMQSFGKKAKAVSLTAYFGAGQTVGRLTSLFFAVRARSLFGSGTRAFREALLWQPVVGTVLLCVVHAVAVAFDSDAAMTYVLAFCGLPYGLSWTSLFHTMDVLFDSPQLVTTLGMVFGPGLGPLLINVLVGTLYDGNLPADGSGVCLGGQCYRSSFNMLLAFDFVALAMAVAIRQLALGSTLPLTFDKGKASPRAQKSSDAVQESGGGMRKSNSALRLRKEPSFVILDSMPAISS